jgi:acetyl-CoA C-acetyltransferase
MAPQPCSLRQRQRLRRGLTPRARVIGMAAAGIAPRIMGVGPIEAARKVLARHALRIDQLDVIELNEAFASQAIATLRDLGIDPLDPRVNPPAGRSRWVTHWACLVHGSR